MIFEAAHVSITPVGTDAGEEGAFMCIIGPCNMARPRMFNEEEIVEARRSIGVTGIQPGCRGSRFGQQSDPPPSLEDGCALEGLLCAPPSLLPFGDAHALDEVLQ
jgi:hypothetical protein